jgi:Protein of unknown function (DUF551)/Helix-turn-helix
MNDQIIIDAMYEEAERLGSGKKLAKKLDISEQYLSDILNGRRNVSEVIGLQMGFRAVWLKEPKWISVKRRLPPEGEHVLTFEDGSITMNYIPYCNAVGIAGTSYVGRFASGHDFVSHWMPLPSPPEGQ